MDDNMTGLFTSDPTGAATDYGTFTPSYQDDASTGVESSSAALHVASTTIDTSPITWDDATWILTSSFIIFTMQSGKPTFVNTFITIYIKDTGKSVSMDLHVSHGLVSSF
jgi:hypothetical protein